VSHRKFILTEQQVDDRTREIGVAGELDLAVANQLDQVLERTTTRRILIDLSACDFIDSSGIAVILRANLAAQRRDNRILVHSANEAVQRTLAITGLLDAGLVFASREEAMAQPVPGDDSPSAP
jgi:anti-anti-sigma factor